MHPQLTIFGLTLYSYGLMIAVGVVLGSRYLVALSTRAGLDPDGVIRVFAVALVAGLCGARLFYVVEFYGPLFAGRPWTAMLRVQDGGLVFFGGAIAGALAAGASLAGQNAARRARGEPALPALRVCDVLACAMPVGLACGRMGCFLNGCCWGVRDTAGRALLAVRFPPGSPAFAAHVARYGLPETATCSYAVHATQLYELAAALVMIGVLALAHRRLLRDGQVFGLLGVLYGPVRFGIEALREHDAVAERSHIAGWLYDPIAGAPMTNSQLVSIAIFAAGLVALVVLRRGDQRPVATAVCRVDAPGG